MNQQEFKPIITSVIKEKKKKKRSIVINDKITMLKGNRGEQDEVILSKVEYSVDIDTRKSDHNGITIIFDQDKTLKMIEELSRQVRMNQYASITISGSITMYHQPEEDPEIEKPIKQ